MTVFSDDVRARAAAADVTGPALWAEAWKRVADVLVPAWGDRPVSGSPAAEPDTAETLAVALYLLAAERGAAPGEFSRDDVAQLAAGDELAKRWGARLAELGHTPGNEADPVAACWDRLSYDHPDPPDSYLDADASLHQIGDLATTCLGYLLSPAERENIQF